MPGRSRLKMRWAACGWTPSRRKAATPSRGRIALYGSTESLQQDNITPELRPFIRAGDTLDFLYDSNLVLGGPLRHDRLWYFGIMRVSQSNLLVANTFFKDGRQADRGGMVLPNATVRLTYQMSPRNKIVFAYHNSWGGGGGTRRYDVGGGATSGNLVAITEPEASYELFAPLNYSSQLKWQSPVTSRLLLEVHQSLAVGTYKFRYQQEPPAGPIGPFDVQHLEATTSRRTVATQTNNTYFTQIWNTVANMSYVTGSHAFKAGVNQAWGYSTTGYENHGDMSVLTFINGRPSSVGVRNTPTRVHPNLNADLGAVCAGQVDPRSAHADRRRAVGLLQRVDRRGFGRAADASCRRAKRPTSIACRAGATGRSGRARRTTVFGNGKDGGQSFGGQVPGVAGAGAGQPASTRWPFRPKRGRGRIWTATARPWTRPATRSTAEIGPKRNANFGLPVGQTKVDPNLPRSSNWEESVSVQQELMSGVSITAGYYRRQFYNLGVTKNLLVDPALDWTPFTIRPRAIQAAERRR